jgi:predicted transposase YdaD
MSPPRHRQQRCNKFVKLSSIHLYREDFTTQNFMTQLKILILNSRKSPLQTCNHIKKKKKMLQTCHRRILQVPLSPHRYRRCELNDCIGLDRLRRSLALVDDLQ